jgi:hypothetical protein
MDYKPWVEPIGTQEGFKPDPQLTQEQVDQIYRMRGDGRTRPFISVAMDLDLFTIDDVLRGRYKPKQRHIEPEYHI